MRLLVAWEISRIHDPRLFVMLLEHKSNLNYDEKGLQELLEEHSNRFKVQEGRDETTWLMQDSTVLKTVMDVTSQGRYKLEITIVEGTRDQYTTNPLYYEPKK
jgi:hypothetical protein